MKQIVFAPTVPSEVRAIDKDQAFRILKSLHRYAECGEGDVKALAGEFEGLLRLRVGEYRVLFLETDDRIMVERVRARRDAYR